MSKKSDASFYRWGGMVVCVVKDEDSPIGQRLTVPRWGKNLPPFVLKHYPPLPKAWRRLIQESIKERKEAVN